MKKILILVLVMVVAGTGLARPAAGAPAPDGRAAAPADTTSLMQRVTAGVEAYNRALAALGTKDHEGYLAALRESLPLLGPHPTLLRRLAGACALTGRRDEALSFLARFVDLQVAGDLAADSSLAGLRDTDAFRALLARHDLLQTPVANGEAAFHLPDRDLLTEGIAYDRVTGSFFVTSVHQRKVVRVDRGGAASDFAAGERAGLWAAVGICADPVRRSLWVVSATGPAMSGFRESDAGKAALFRFDLDTGSRTGIWAPPDTAGGHEFNDLTIDGAGRVYISDPGVGALYTLGPGAVRLEALVGPNTLPGPQGLALSRDGKTLYVACYQFGLVAVDLVSRDLAVVAAPDSVVLIGIDGLASYDGDLIAIQNGIRPNRAVRIRINAAGTAVVGAETLDRDHPLFDEPTLGVVAGDDFYYVANSQWGSFGPDAPADAAGKRQEPVILRVRLK